MSEKFEQLKTRLGRISDLTLTGWLMQWDQQVLMPPGGAISRGDQMSARCAGISSGGSRFRRRW
jgi:Zn-dependent M32 family carboxypeptidase